MTSDKLTSKIHQKLFLLLVLLLPTQLGFHFWPDWASVYGIRVDYLSPTIYLTDLLVVGILISWMLNFQFPTRRVFRISSFQSIFKSTSFKLSLLGITYLFITCVGVADNHWVALYKLVKLIEFALLGFYVFTQNTKYSILNTLRLPLSISLIYSSILAWLQFMSGHTSGLWLLGERTFDVNTPGIALVDIGGQDFLRAYATFPHPNVLAGFLLVGTILLLAGPAPGFPPRTSTRARQARLFGGPPTRATREFLIAFIVATIIITFSHSAWIAGLASLLFLKLKWFANHAKIHSIPLSIFALSSVEGAKIFTQITIIGAVVVSLLFSVISRNVDTTTLPEEVGRRVELARVAGAMISDFPLTGVGLGNFIVRLPEYGGSPQVSWWLQPVHNIFLLALSETGLIGIGLFTWLLLKIAKLEIAFLVILMTGMSDHYWLTLQQGQLMVVIVTGALLSATIKRDA